MGIFNIDDSANLLPEEEEAYRKLLQRAIVENRSINIYDVKGYRDPKRREKHLQEQQNIMRLGLPATVSLWDDLDPAFEISNKTPSSKLALGEVYGGFNPATDNEQNYRGQYGPTLGLNYDRIGKSTLVDMAENNLPIEQYKKLYADNVYNTLEHEREHTYIDRRIPFGNDPKEIVGMYLKVNPAAITKIPSIVKNFLGSLHKTDPILSELYTNVLQKDPSQVLSLFEELSARGMEDGTADEEIKKYSKWKRTGLFE
jgi:hypothetical protein